jgi:hypothetical protein
MTCGIKEGLLAFGFPTDFTWYKLLTDWGSLIGGILALIAAAALYYISRKQARITDAALKLAREEYSATHRPKLRIKHVWLAEALLPNKQVTVNVEYVNIGDTKALVQSIGMDFNVINPGAQLPGNLTPPGRRYIEYPECGLGVTANTGNVSSLGPLDEERVNAIMSGAKLLCCFGFIEYFDTGPNETRKIRTTSFCRVFRPSLRAIDGIGRFWNLPEPDPDYEYED